MPPMYNNKVQYFDASALLVRLDTSLSDISQENSGYERASGDRGEVITYTKTQVYVPVEVCL